MYFAIELLVGFSPNFYAERSKPTDSVDNACFVPLFVIVNYIL